MSSPSFARTLCRNQTSAETLLWSRLKNRQLSGRKFRRQMPILGFIADFACPDAKLIIELDGSQHAQQADADHIRTLELERAGYLVLRFCNNEISENLDGVLETISATLEPVAFTRAP
jgi:lysyl-tRNA synthetase class 2